MQTLLPISEAGQFLGISRSTIYSLLNSGALRAVKIGKRTMFRREDLTDYLASLPAYRPATRSGQ